MLSKRIQLVYVVAVNNMNASVTANGADINSLDVNVVMNLHENFKSGRPTRKTK